MSFKTVLSVEGMTCNNCAQTIAKHLTKKGIENVHVDFPAGEVEIENSIPVDDAYVIAEINSLGYRATEKNTEELIVSAKGKFTKAEWHFFLCALFTLPLLVRMILPIPFLDEPFVQFFLCVPVLAMGLKHFGPGAWGSVKVLMPNMDVLIVIGSTTAFIYSTIGWYLYHDNIDVHNYLFYETSATIITLVLLGNLIEQRSLKKTNHALEQLTKMQPQYATKIINALTAEEKVELIDAKEVRVNDLILVNTGEQIPADGIIYWGTCIVDESAMTGESIPADKKENDNVLAGTVVINGGIKILVQQAGSGTVLSAMIEMVKKAANRKPKIQKIGDRVSAYFVPIVILISIITFFISYYIGDKTIQVSILSSIAVLVISCPCAMGLATPTAVAVGVGRAARNGILIKGGDIIEKLSEINCIVFDKTGTLTEGKLSIREIRYYDEQDVVNYLLGTLEKHSSHPIAKTLAAEFENSKLTNPIQFKEIREEKGFGIYASDKNGNQYIIGSEVSIEDTSFEKNHQVYVVKNGLLLAWIDFNDRPRNGVSETIHYFKTKGIRTIMLSGDTAERCESLAKTIGIDEVYSTKLPTEKVKIIRELQLKGNVAMVGDGINDAAALAEAWVGIAMGSGTQIALQSADILLLKPDNLTILKKAHLLAAECIVTIKQNLFWAFIYNVIAIPVAGFGLLSPMIASMSMAFSDVVVIGNSLRLRIKKSASVK